MNLATLPAPVTQPGKVPDEIDVEPTPMRFPWRVSAEGQTTRARAGKLPLALRATRERRRRRRGEHAAIAGFVQELSLAAAGRR